MRSHNTKLTDLDRKRQRLDLLSKQIAEEEERIVAPTRGKISGIFLERLQAFLKGHMDRIPEVSIQKEAFAAAIDAFLAKQLFAASGERPAGQAPVQTPADAGDAARAAKK